MSNMVTKTMSLGISKSKSDVDKAQKVKLFAFVFICTPSRSFKTRPDFNGTLMKILIYLRYTKLQFRNLY